MTYEEIEVPVKPISRSIKGNVDDIVLLYLHDARYGDSNGTARDTPSDIQCHCSESDDFQI